MALARRVLAFAGLPFLSLLTPFLFLPVLARIAGADAWVAIAIGQSVGGFAALFVSYGYNTVGPTAVAAETADSRVGVLERSIAPRLLLLLPALVVAVAVAASIAPGRHRIDAALMAVALTITGLSSAWYMVGLGRAGLIVVYEVLPRIVATAGAAAALLLLGQVTWYPVLLIAAGLLGPGLFVARTVGASALAIRPAAARAELRANRSAFATEAAAGAYNSLAVTFVSLTAPVAQAAAYVSGDKLYRIGQYSVSALGNALQGWAVEDVRRDFARRARTALLLHLGLGVLGLVAFAALGPWLSGVLFGAAVAIDLPTALGFGAATVGIALGTALGRVILVGLGARREFMVSVIAGAAVGIPAVLVLASAFGAAGGAWGLALGEAVSVTCQAMFAWRTWRRAQLAG